MRVRSAILGLRFGALFLLALATPISSMAQTTSGLTCGPQKWQSYWAKRPGAQHVENTAYSSAEAACKEAPQWFFDSHKGLSRNLRFVGMEDSPYSGAVETQYICRFTGTLFNNPTMTIAPSHTVRTVVQQGVSPDGSPIWMSGKQPETCQNSCEAEANSLVGRGDNLNK